MRREGGKVWDAWRHGRDRRRYIVPIGRIALSARTSHSRHVPSFETDAARVPPVAAGSSTAPHTA